MEKKLKKDLKLRESFVKNEILKMNLKSIAFNKILPLAVRQKAMIELDSLPKDTSKMRNYCIATGRSRGLIKEFKVSRLIFKQLADNGEIPGIRRSS